MAIVKIKRAKDTKTYVIKRKLKFENYESCLESTQKTHKELIKSNKLILQTQQRFKSEKHNVFIEEINNIGLSSNDDKKMQSIDSIATYAYVTIKDLVSEKEEIKCSNIIKQYKKLLALIML